jgi:nitrogen regulatory protein P-II 1
MKKLEAIIDPIALGDVRQALEEIGLTDLIVSDVRGTDQHGTYTEIFRGVEYTVDFVLRLKLEAIVDDGCVDEIAEAVTKAAATTPSGVSQVFIYPIEKIATPAGDGPESFP